MRQEQKAQYEAIVLGGGIVGLSAAAHLQKAGIRFCVVEAASEVGGTWRDHDYPGCGADTEASTYVPLFEPLYSKFRFPTRDELFDYCKRIARVHVGYDNIKLEHRIRAVEFSADTASWQVRTSRGTLEGKFLVFATFSGGAVDKVKRPVFKNQEQFKGKIFHSSQLGKSCELFQDQRVAIVGCGASTVQIVPTIQKHARSITIFRRSMPYIKKTRRTAGPRSALGYRLQGAALRLKNELISMFDGLPALEFLYRWPYRLMEYGIKGRSLPREAIPPFRQPVQCTRRAFDYLGFRDALAEEHVELVDISSGGIEGYYDHGLVANGQSYPCDVVVLATGYHMGEINFEIRVNGDTFDPVPEKLVGMYGFVEGLPNAQISVFGTPLWIIPPRTAEFNTQYLIRIIDETRKRGVKIAEINSEFAHRMTRQVRQMNRRHIVISKYCPSFRYLLSNTEEEKQGRSPRKVVTNLAYVPFPRVVMEWITRVLFSFKHFDFDSARRLDLDAALPAEDGVRENRVLPSSRGMA